MLVVQTELPAMDLPTGETQTRGSLVLRDIFHYQDLGEG